MHLDDIITVPRTDPIYNAHGYLTKVPVGAIRPFIEEFSEPGELVVDPFAGSGMTGVTAMMTGRRAELSDISVLGRHVARGFLSIVDNDQLERIGAKVIDAVRADVGYLYRTVRVEDGADVEWVRTIWSFVYLCPHCGERMNFYTTIAGTGRSSPKSCPHCDGPFRKRHWECIDDVPVAVVTQGVNGTQVEQPIGQRDVERIDLARSNPRLTDVPTLEIGADREMYRRSALKRWGLTQTKHFFTARNALVLLHLWRRISEVADRALREKLMFAFTAILPRASRRYQWSPKRPLNAQNQTYYISPVHYEWNVFDLFQRKVRATMRAQEFRDQNRLFSNGIGLGQGIEYRLASANKLQHLPDGSVDYVFTDPPFGSNIFYSDMNLFQEAWLGQTTDPRHEAVIHTGGGRKEDASTRYENLLAAAFQEVFRVLRPGRHMSVVFGSSRGSVWSMVQRAIQNSGFETPPTHLALLDKGQRSVKGLASGREHVVTVDLVLTVRKPKARVKACRQASPLPVARTTLVHEAIEELSPEEAQNPSYVYVGVIKKAIQRRMSVESLHLSDVLIALGEAGYSIDPLTGLLKQPLQKRVHVTSD